MRKLLALVALPLLSTTACTPAQQHVATPSDAPVAAANSAPTAAQRGVVSSADPRASEAGAEILRQGGSASDAAMAMMLALTVVEPQSSGIGGGGFLLYHDAKSDQIGTIDGREKAPAAAKPSRFLGADGKPMPFMQAVAGGRSVGVPGNIRLMEQAHRKWGKLEWKALFQPAIRLAEQGYAVSRPLALWLPTASRIWSRFPAAASIYLDANGQPLPQGTIVRNPELARTLRLIADQGADGFYKGANAQALVSAVTGFSDNPGDIRLADLTTYEAKERPAVCSTYRSYRICGMGPPSSGATTVLQILGMLERFDLGKLGKDSPVAWHLIGEAMQLAYADREKYLGDADFVDVPVAGLIDRGYLAQRSQLIAIDRARSDYPAGSPPGAAPRTAAVQAEVPGTTHFVAIDRDGDVATMTSTVEGPFGSQLVTGGYVLNNELTDFTFAPEKDGAPVANRVEPGKRPLSSMSPTIVYDASGKAVFTVGAAGGKTIIMQVTKALIAHLDWGLSAQEALAQPVLYYNAEGLVLEPGTSLVGMTSALQAMGHKLSVQQLGFKANAAEWTPSGWRGAADPRSVGVAVGE